MRCRDKDVARCLDLVLAELELRSTRTGSALRCLAAFHQRRHEIEKLAGEEAHAPHVAAEPPPRLPVEINAPERRGQRVRSPCREAPDDAGKRVSGAGRGETDAAAVEAERPSIGGDDVAEFALDERDGAIGLGGQPSRPQTTGSGVIVRPDGIVVTNNHVRGKGVANAMMLQTMLTGRKVEAPETLVRAYPQELGPYVRQASEAAGHPASP